MAQSQILFFDGECNLCNGFVDTLMKSSYPGEFATLQGQTAEKHLPLSQRTDLNSVIYLKDNRFYLESQAVVRVLMDSGPAYSVLGGLLGCLPGFVADYFYRQVAANRYRIFGKRDTCRLPTPEEAERFLS